MSFVKWAFIVFNLLVLLVILFETGALTFGFPQLEHGSIGKGIAFLGIMMIWFIGNACSG